MKKEIIEKRQLNEKHFLNEDGTFEAQIFDHNIHYLKSGKYEEIDNSLVKRGEKYKNKFNDFEVIFDKKISQLLTIKRGNKQIKFGIKGKNSKISKTKNKLRYIDVYDNIDIDYQVSSNKVKEQIIVKNKNSIISPIVFDIDTNLVIEQDGNHINIDEFRIEAPFMVDSNGVRNDNIYYELGNQELILHLDVEWLQSPERVFPVYIDPTITTRPNSNMMDTYIDSNTPDKNYYKEEKLLVGVFYAAKDICRSLIKFDLPIIGTGSTVIEAKLNLISYPHSYPDDVVSYSIPINVHQIIEDWNSQTATWNNMNNKYNQHIEEYCNSKYGLFSTGVNFTPTINTFNITNLVKKWYSGIPNYGLLLKTDEGPDSLFGSFNDFFSSSNQVTGDNPKPFITITYRNQNGLEPYLDYQEQSLPHSKTYINNYNGNATVLFNLGSTTGNLPANLDLIYNTNDVILNQDYGFGRGMKLSLYQTIKKVVIENSELYEYLDEDGTIHYFWPKKVTENDVTTTVPNTYVDEDGLNITLKLENEKLILIDKDGNKMIFNNNNNNIYYLSTIIDTKASEINILYSNNRIVKVIDSSNQEISINYTDSITIISKETKSLLFDQGKMMSLIDNMGVTDISYNDRNIIQSITDNGQKISFEYYESIPYRIKKINQIGLNENIGRSLEYSYSFNATRVKDSKGKVIKYTFNELGNTVSSMSFDSNEDINRAFGKTVSYGINKNKNKILNELDMMRYIDNLLWNSSFEKEDLMFNSNGLEMSLDNTYYNTGSRSLKLSGIGSSTIDVSIENDYYTFSCYSKSDIPFKIILNGADKIKTLEVSPNEDFRRNSVTILASNIINIAFQLESNGNVYIDDVQLEKGKIANYYNIVDNGNFRHGLAGWNIETRDYGLGDNVVHDPLLDIKDELIDLENSKCLKIDLGCLHTREVKRIFNISGKKGDTYYISFWYKNMSTPPYKREENDRILELITVLPSVMIGMDARILDSVPLTINNDEWQFYSTYISMPEDYQDFIVEFFSRKLVNSLYITNFMMIKGLEVNAYDYDEKGNLISHYDKNKSANTFKYDKNNQLIKMTDPKGSNFSCEYDNEIKNRVLNAISPTGIANSIKYDSFGNPIITKIEHLVPSEIMPITYYIQLKSNNKYFNTNDDYKTIILGGEKEAWQLDINKYGICLKSLKYDKVYTISDIDISNVNFQYNSLDEGYYLFQDKKIMTMYEEGLDFSETIDPTKQEVLFIETASNKAANAFKQRTYYIRQKGTEKYLRNNPANKVIVSDKNCSLEKWKILFLNNTIKIQSIYYDSYLTLDTYLSDLYFEYIKQDNGSYILKNNDTYLTVQNSNLILDPKIDLDNQQFYFEISDDNYFIENTATYTSDGKFLTSTTDTLLNTTSYNVNEQKGLINSITDAIGNVTNYNYNSKDQIIKISKGDMVVDYEYNNFNLLSEIVQGNKQYQFVYDEFLNQKEIYINDNKLIENNFENNNGNLVSSKYGNNNIIFYDYDSFNRMNKVIKMNNIYQNYYDNFGNLRIIETNDNKYYYDYDIAKRLTSYKENDFSAFYQYNSSNKLVSKEFIHNNQNYHSIYEYNTEEAITKIMNDNLPIIYDYDSLGRVVLENRNGQIIKYSYITNGKRTSNLISKVEMMNHIYQYQYDKLGNITKIYLDNIMINQYFYDMYNQLVKEINPNGSIEYTYDLYGNLLNVKTYDLTNTLMNTNTYQYQNPLWLDQLTAYNNTLITYDEIGNPKTIGEATLTWMNGRELFSYSDSNNNITYQYNKDGIRTQKTANGIQTKYYLEGNDIIFEKQGNNMIYYLRDSNSLVGFIYNQNTYYYVKNIQNDILGILNSDLEQIASYEYDSFGKINSIKDANNVEITDDNHIANINPFRYRSYYYDKETGLYYLNSRYYSPTWGRFVNSDNYISTDTGLLGHNMYSYCNNNAINCEDGNGHLFGLILLATALVTGISVAINTNIQKNKANKEIKKVQDKYPNSCPNPIASQKFEQTLKKNADTIKKETQNMNFLQKTIHFSDNVKTGAKYDLKNTDEWKDKTLYVDGIVMEPQDVGNYHFGYIGRAIGYNTSFLTLGAGAYQLMGDTRNFNWCLTTSACDDPRDTYFIKLGAIAYDQQN